MRRRPEPARGSMSLRGLADDGVPTRRARFHDRAGQQMSATRRQESAMGQQAT